MVTPSPALTNDVASSSLTALSCTAPNACVAVGSTPCGGPLVERWNGTVWARQTLPDATCQSPLYGVSCTSARWCVATGGGLEVWNGKRWSPGGPNGNRDGRTWCAATRACAMIAIDWARADWWNWRRLRSASASGGYRVTPSFYDVSCRSVRSCIAVGYDGIGNALTAVWNGTSWRLQYPAENTSYAAVGCGARQCVIFGQDEVRSVTIWDGKRYRRRATGISSGTHEPPLPGTVSCVKTRCVAAISSSGHVGIWQNF